MTHFTPALKALIPEASS